MPEPERIDRRRAAGYGAPRAGCLGSVDRGSASRGRAGDLHHASQSRRWRRRRYAADRPFGRNRRAATQQCYRGHGRGRLFRGYRAAARGLRLPQAPAERTGVAELLHMLRRDIIIGGGATNRGVETSVREAFNFDLKTVVVRECCWGSDAAAHAYSLDKAMKMYARVRSLDQVTAMLRE